MRLGITMIALLAACGGGSKDAASPPRPQEPTKTLDQPAPAPPPPAAIGGAAGPRSEGEGDVDGAETADDKADSLKEKRELTRIEDATEAFVGDRKLLDDALSGAARADNASACSRVCRALGSMRRSVDAICRLAGDSDARCKDARGVLDKSGRRVEGAGCSC